MRPPRINGSGVRLMVVVYLVMGVRGRVWIGVRGSSIFRCLLTQDLSIFGRIRRRWVSGRWLLGAPCFPAWHLW